MLINNISNPIRRGFTAVVLFLVALILAAGVPIVKSRSYDIKILTGADQEKRIWLTV
jgi:Na+-transporting NADH:ubiquinone oxidoreductase subunit NqrF